VVCEARLCGRVPGIQSGESLDDGLTMRRGRSCSDCWRNGAEVGVRPASSVADKDTDDYAECEKGGHDEPHVFVDSDA